MKSIQELLLTQIEQVSKYFDELKFSQSCLSIDVALFKDLIFIEKELISLLIFVRENNIN